MEAAASDPFFLDWGSSVNVNEDLRRTIRNEIEGIESDINSLQSNVKVEEKMSSQLTKDFAHARAELMNLSRGATDDRDNSIMNEQIQMRLRDSLMMEVVSVITPPSSPEEKSSSSISSSPPSSSTSPSSDIDPQTSPVPVQKHQGSNDNDNSNERHLGKYLSKCAIEVKELSTMLQKKKANIEEYKTKLSTIQYEIQTIVNQSDRDQKTQKTWSDDVDEKRREFDIEKQRIRCGKEAIQRARKLNGHHAQRLANDSKTLSSNKAQNANIESKYENDKKTIEENLSHLSTNLSTLTGIDSELSSQLDNLMKQFIERKEIISKRSIVQQMCQEKKKTIEETRKREDELRKELSRLKESLSVKEIHLNDCKRQKMEIEQLKVKNDKDEQEILKPAQECYPKLLEEKEALAKTITELHDSSASHKQDFESRKMSNTSVLNKLNSAYKEKLEYVEVTKQEIAKMKELMDESNTATNKEIEEHEQIAKNLDEALQAQKLVIEEKKEQFEKAIESTKLEWSRKMKLKSYEVELLKKGAEIITKTKEVENKFAAEGKANE